MSFTGLTATRTDDMFLSNRNAPETGRVTLETWAVIFRGFSPTASGSFGQTGALCVPHLQMSKHQQEKVTATFFIFYFNLIFLCGLLHADFILWKSMCLTEWHGVMLMEFSRCSSTVMMSVTNCCLQKEPVIRALSHHHQFPVRTDLSLLDVSVWSKLHSANKNAFYHPTKPWIVNLE